jgi:hypothetical protein
MVRRLVAPSVKVAVARQSPIHECGRVRSGTILGYLAIKTARHSRRNYVHGLHFGDQQAARRAGANHGHRKGVNGSSSEGIWLGEPASLVS